MQNILIQKHAERRRTSFDKYSLSPELVVLKDTDVSRNVLIWNGGNRIA